jgi:ATP-binding cassette subfamily B protein
LVEQGNHRQLRAAGGLYAQLADLQEKGLASL